MPKISAGLLLFRRGPGGHPQVLLVHPGGPYFRQKDEGVWTIPKGEPDPGEDLLTAARREVLEETGWQPTGECVPLGQVRQRSGKEVHAWAVPADLDLREFRSNRFVLEWPPHSGRQVEFPEVDRAAYFDLPEARSKLNGAQVHFLDELARLIDSGVL
jgi:predicted NUDIX family NTP pyrophosphohydrolase